MEILYIILIGIIVVYFLNKFITAFFSDIDAFTYISLKDGKYSTKYYYEGTCMLTDANKLMTKGVVLNTAPPTLHELGSRVVIPEYIFNSDYITVKEYKEQFINE